MPNRSPDSNPARADVIESIADGVTIGVLGARWRGSVTPWGAVRQWDDMGTLDWHVAADDRWHTPAAEPTIRQTRLDGTPVIETRLRVPKGDVVHRVFASADHGGMTLIEVHNDSPMPVAIAFSGSRVTGARPAARVPIEGIDLPLDTVVFPVGHQATITVALGHEGVLDSLPQRLPTAVQVARGWSAVCERASRLLLPDAALADAVTAARCELLLAGPPLPADDPVGFLLAVDQIVRMVGGADQWMPEVADAVGVLARGGRTEATAAELAVALEAAAAIADRADDTRAQRDLAKLRRRFAPGEQPMAARWLPDPGTVTGARFVCAVERRSASGGDLLPAGLPVSWFGQNFEVHGVPTIGASSISYAVRWHGDRPAILWECSGAPVRLTASFMAPGWSSDQPTGETLWPAPTPSVAHVSVAADEPGSFS